MTDPDGTVYEGMFKKGYKHGEGTLTKKSGKCIKGEWKMGELVESFSSSRRR